jgi:hypothetical protein
MLVLSPWGGFPLGRLETGPTSTGHWLETTGANFPPGLEKCRTQ